MSTSQQSRWRLFEDESKYVDRFGLLLVVIVVAVVTLSLVDLSSDSDSIISEIGIVFVTLIVGATLLLALRASGVGTRFLLVADIAIGIGVSATLVIFAVDILTGDGGSRVSSFTPSLAWVILSALAPIVLVRRLMKHRRATLSTLLGAVAAYLLIALTFDFMFLLTDSAIDGAFFGSAEPTTSFMYYSFVTIATLGYGDLTTTSAFGRLLSMFETILGQVYLITFVSMIVGLLVGQRQSERATEPVPPIFDTRQDGPEPQ
ncbi:MAG: ion channel [Acidimicrobiia bacterium]|nr:ion channel [Acidimicrobiia bacterium]